MKDKKAYSRVKSLMDAGYTQKLAEAIAKYPREHWTKVRKNQEKLLSKAFGDAFSKERNSL